MSQQTASSELSDALLSPYMTDTLNRIHSVHHTNKNSNNLPTQLLTILLPRHLGYCNDSKQHVNIFFITDAQLTSNSTKEIKQHQALQYLYIKNLVYGLECK